MTRHVNRTDAAERHFAGLQQERARTVACGARFRDDRLAMISLGFLAFLALALGFVFYAYGIEFFVAWYSGNPYEWGISIGAIKRGDPLDYPKIWRIAQSKTSKPVRFGTCCSQVMALFLDIHTDKYKDSREVVWDMAVAMNAELPSVSVSVATRLGGGEAGAEVHRRGGLPHPALLVRDRVDGSHTRART